MEQYCEICKRRGCPGASSSGCVGILGERLLPILSEYIREVGGGYDNLPNRAVCYDVAEKFLRQAFGEQEEETP